MSAPEIAKRVINAGSGHLPAYGPGTRVTFHYSAHILGEEVVELEDSRKAWPRGYGQEMQLVMGKKFQVSFKLEVWEECLKTMRLNEISSFDCLKEHCIHYPMVSKKLRDIAKGRLHKHEEQQKHSCAFGMASQGTGYELLDGLIKEIQPIRFIFHLTKVEGLSDYEPDSWQLDEYARLSSIHDLKLKGNELTAASQFKQAIEVYSEACSRLESLILREKPGEPEWVDLDRQKIPLLLNLAQCYLKTGAYYDAKRCAEEVLQRETTNIKGLFRRAKANSFLWEIDAAREDFLLVQSYDPSMKLIVERELKALDLRQESKKSEETKCYKAMFNAFS